MTRSERRVAAIEHLVRTIIRVAASPEPESGEGALREARERLARELDLSRVVAALDDLIQDRIRYTPAPNEATWSGVQDDLDRLREELG